MFYIGKVFDKEQNKAYKTQDGAEKAAQKAGLNVYDDGGKAVAQYAESAAEGAQDAPDAGAGNSTPEAPDAAQSAAEGAEKGKDDAPDVIVTMSDDVPDGALDTAADGSVKTYTPEGEESGSVSGADLEKIMASAQDGTGVRIKGVIRRVFNGAVRIRRRPSWDESAVAGISTFDEKRVVGCVSVDGKPMYKIDGGFYVTADPEIVKYIPAE